MHVTYVHVEGEVLNHVLLIMQFRTFLQCFLVFYQLLLYCAHYYYHTKYTSNDEIHRLGTKERKFILELLEISVNRIF